MIHYNKLKGLCGGDMGVANVYLFNISNERCILWVKMIQKLPRDCRWILVGDYNMIKSSTYKLSECGWLIFQIKVACKELAQNLL